MTPPRKLAIVSLAILTFAGCGCSEDSSSSEAEYYGRVNSRRLNGKIQDIGIVFPPDCSIDNRSDGQNLLKLLEAMTTDLKAAVEQLPIKEEIAPPPQTDQPSKS